MFSWKREKLIDRISATSDFGYDVSMYSNIYNCLFQIHEFDKKKLHQFDKTLIDPVFESYKLHFNPANPTVPPYNELLFSIMNSYDESILDKIADELERQQSLAEQCPDWKYPEDEEH